MNSAHKCRVKCIYVDGEPQPLMLILLREPLAKVAIVTRCEVYSFALMEEAKEFLRQRLRLKDFEIGPCPN